MESISVSKVVLFILFSFVALSHFEIPGAQRDKFTIKNRKTTVATIIWASAVCQVIYT